MQPTIQHTLYLFEMLYKALPPLVPETVKTDMGQALEHIKNNPELSIEDLEDTMIVYGKLAWPYRKAFQEFIDLAEGRLGEQFFEGKLTPELKHRYLAFKNDGGSFRDLHIGRRLEFFSAEERGVFCEALIEMNKEMVRHVVQAVLSHDRRKYESRIVEFATILTDIEKRLDLLRQLADDEQKHPMLADEIRSRVREFEFGLCSIAPTTEFEEICRSIDHFEGRKEDLNRKV